MIAGSDSDSPGAQKTDHPGGLPTFTKLTHPRKITFTVGCSVYTNMEPQAQLSYC